MLWCTLVRVGAEMRIFSLALAATSVSSTKHAVRISTRIVPTSCKMQSSGFENLVGADVRCGDYSVFKISSCPRHVWEDKQKTEPGDDNSLMHPSVTSENRLEQSSHTANILQSMIEVGTSTLSIPSSSKRSSKSITNSLKSAVLNAPVTDLSTGITYMNRIIYDCHNRHSTNSSLSTWALKLDYIYSNPKSLEDLGPSGW